jgi:hypothetical protein
MLLQDVGVVLAVLLAGAFLFRRLRPRRGPTIVVVRASTLRRPSRKG